MLICAWYAIGTRAAPNPMTWDADADRLTITLFQSDRRLIPGAKPMRQSWKLDLDRGKAQREAAKETGTEPRASTIGPVGCNNRRQPRWKMVRDPAIRRHHPDSGSLR